MDGDNVDGILWITFRTLKDFNLRKKSSGSFGLHVFVKLARSGHQIRTARDASERLSHSSLVLLRRTFLRNVVFPETNMCH